MTNGLERLRYEAIVSRWSWFGSKVDWRYIKQHERAHGDPVYDAYVWGQSNMYVRHPIANPYPPGRRHDAFERGMRDGREPNVRAWQ